jgi:hypothetical protein
MYYAEKLINGIWHYKTSPNMKWKEMGAVRLANKIAALERRIKQLELTAV